MGKTVTQLTQRIRIVRQNNPQQIARLIAILLLYGWLFLVMPALAEDLQPVWIAPQSVKVLDGDTIEVSGEKIRLFGIDAPESRQVCRRGGLEWLCGAEATKALRELVRHHQINCSGRGRDRYERLIAVCFADGKEINETMVREGWALAFRRYSKTYVGAEDAAREAGNGLWAGEFVPPWEWRKFARDAHGS